MFYPDTVLASMESNQMITDSDSWSGLRGKRCVR